MGLGFLSDRSEHSLLARDYCSINNVLRLYDLNHTFGEKKVRMHVQLLFSPPLSILVNTI